MNASDESITLELIRIALPFISAVAGWFIASRLQDIRERRKEIRSLIDEAKELINDAHSLTMEYYSPSNRQPICKISAEIKLKNMLIGQYFLIIGQAGMPIRSTQEIIRFNQLSTGDYFETKDFKKRFNDAEWQSAFTAATNELWMLLDKRYFSLFKIPGMGQEFTPSRLMPIERTKFYRTPAVRIVPTAPTTPPDTAR